MQKIKKQHNLRRYGYKYSLWNHLLDPFVRTAIRIFALLTISVMKSHTTVVVVMSVVGRKTNFVQGQPNWIKSGYKKKPTCDLCGFRSTYSSQITVFSY
jgi:hypothetical protein